MRSQSVMLVYLLVALGLISVMTAGAPVASARPARTLVPLIYVAGADADLAAANRSFADPMRKRGFTVHVFTYSPAPEYSPLVTITGNSKRLERFVDRIVAQTGQRRFDVVGVSQSGMITRYWLKYFGGDQHARKVVLLSGIVKGSPYQAAWVRQGLCPPVNRRWNMPARYRSVRITPGCYEQAQGSTKVTALNTPREALEGIDYLNVSTTLEAEAAPYQQNFMAGPGRYRNVLTQDFCPNDPVLHSNIYALSSVHSLISSFLRGQKLQMRCMVAAPRGAPNLRQIPPLSDPPVDAPFV